VDKYKRRYSKKRFNPFPPTAIRGRIPSGSNLCAGIPRHEFSSKCFDSIREARAFLTYKVPEMSTEECARNSEKINYAKKIVNRADRRNERRRSRRGRSAFPGAFPGAFPSSMQRPLKPKKEEIHYEETLGPEGEAVRFKLIYQDGKFQKRIRTKEEPPIGAVILDLTDGVKAWKRYSDKRRSTPLTAEMRRTYQNSFLFKVRQLAAGKINLSQFLEAVKQVQKRSTIKPEYKKLRRKKRKNR